MLYTFLYEYITEKNYIEHLLNFVLKILVQKCSAKL